MDAGTQLHTLQVSHCLNAHACPPAELQAAAAVARELGDGQAAATLTARFESAITRIGAALLSGARHGSKVQYDAAHAEAQAFEESLRPTIAVSPSAMGKPRQSPLQCCMAHMPHACA
jgi:hypothetical protein